jgi:molybdopterin/thiamine biosynthesis adenylyltransferase
MSDLEALIARLRAISPTVDMLACEDILQAADALERFQKMQPVKWATEDADGVLMETWDTLDGAQQIADSSGEKIAPLYRFPIGEDK